ncbi:hypothetical protein BGZ70_008804 [Mortierella alpina]|uniref:Uncharacterized protein n=1 Tax=Mortierella alpina TaxID=64518 RepID=A0A9P6M0F0_MORAP|nr:hypothetical protein BGZ70_008804 [Mortierella alpina]
MDPLQSDPLLDATVFPMPRRVAHNLDLPYRKLYLVEVLDQKSGSIPQALETLSTSGPFKIRGYVPIEETIYAKGPANLDNTTTEKPRNGEPKAVGEKFVYVQAENITEWTHEFNPKDPRNSIFWVLSRDVCWYQIQSVKDSYAPLFHPLKTVCTYLDTISHLVFESKVKDDLSVLIPVLATVLSQSESTVRQKLFENRERLTDLCESDANLRKLKVYGQWTEEKASAEPTLPPVGGELSAGEARLSLHQPVKAFNTDKIEVAAPADSKEEMYERLPAPCTEDLCPLHLPGFLKMESILGLDLETLIVSKYGQDDSGWSEAETFHCPVPECLITISSSICSSVTEFGCEIVQHIGKHDLSVDGNEDRFKDYLRYSSRVNGKPKSWDTMACQKKDNMQQDLNIQLYWALKAGEFQFSATSGKTPVARTTRLTRNSTVKSASLFLQPAPKINERPRRNIPPRPTTGAPSRASRASSTASTPQHSRTSTLTGSNFIPAQDKIEVTAGPSDSNRPGSSAHTNGNTNPRQITITLKQERRSVAPNWNETARTTPQKQPLENLPAGATTSKSELRNSTVVQTVIGSNSDDRSRHRSRKRKGIKPRSDSIEDARRRRIPKQPRRSEQTNEHDGVVHQPRLSSIKRLRPHVSSRTTDSDGGDRGKSRMEWSGSLQNDSVDDSESDVGSESEHSFVTSVMLGNSRKRWVEEGRGGKPSRRIAHDRHYTPMAMMGSAGDTETETDDGQRARKRLRTVEPRRPNTDDPSVGTERTWTGLDPQRDEGNSRRSRSHKMRDIKGSSFTSGGRRRRGMRDHGRRRGRESSGSRSDSSSSSGRGSSDSAGSSETQTSGSSRSRSRRSESSRSSETSRTSDSGSDGTSSSSSSRSRRSSRDLRSVSSYEGHEDPLSSSAHGGAERRVKQASPVTMKCMKCSRFVRGGTSHVCRF